jgi:hypothetical protein
MPEMCPFCGGSGGKWEPKTRTEMKTETKQVYVPGMGGKPGSYRTQVVTRPVTVTKTERVHCPFCGGTGKKR